MTGSNRYNFSREYILEAPQIVFVQYYIHYTLALVATVIDVGKSTMDKWR